MNEEQFFPGLPPQNQTIEYTTHQIFMSFSEGFRNHLFMISIVLMIYILINRYKYWMKGKGWISTKFIEQWELRSHDIAILFGSYLILIFYI